MISTGAMSSTLPSSSPISDARQRRIGHQMGEGFARLHVAVEASGTAGREMSPLTRNR